MWDVYVLQVQVTSTTSSSSRDDSIISSSCGSRSSRQAAWRWHLGASRVGNSRHCSRHSTAAFTGAQHQQHHHWQQPISIPSAGPSIAQQLPHSKQQQKQQRSRQQYRCRRISWLHGRALRCCTGRALSQGCTGRTPCSRSQCRSCRCVREHTACICCSPLHAWKG